MTTEQARIFLAGLVIIVSLLGSYGLAYLGEPSSVWLWGDVLGVVK